MTKNATMGPLSGVRVLDLSRVLAGPWATQFFGDLGAEVIKIERPGAGDDTRGWGPPFLKGQDGAPTDAAYFLAANRNKKSVAVDIADPEGAALIRKIAASSQILVENFKVGGLAKYGLDYPAIAKINPAIVYCSITGFGQNGPYADRAGYDYMIQAMGGLMSITGQPDGAPGAEPMKVGVAVADLFAGMHAAAATLAALREAERTGRGQQVDVALLDCQIAMLANQATNYLVSGAAPGRLGNAHPNIAPYQVFETADGHIVIAVGNDGQFRAFAGAIGAPALAEDARFASNRSRVGAREALIAAIAPLMRMRTTAAWIVAMEEAGVPAGPINTIEEAFNDPHVRARAMTTPLDRADAGGAAITTHPVKYSRSATFAAAPPRLGADTAQVLAEFLSPQERDDLAARGVIA